MLRLDDANLVPLRDVPRLLPARPSGKRVHISAVYRWVQRGVRGVRLETIRVGGTTYTSREALQSFAEELTARRAAMQSEPGVSRPSWERQQRNVASRLEVELGLPSGRLMPYGAAGHSRRSPRGNAAGWSRPTGDASGG